LRKLSATSDIGSSLLGVSVAAEQFFFRSLSKENFFIKIIRGTFAEHFIVAFST
jgi:hypothetical protein